jgi:hypothetical protein
MAIGQDPKELPLAVVNYENNGEACNDNYYTKECPVTFGAMGLPSTNEHLQVSIFFKTVSAELYGQKEC